jgi:hypothetical protein
VITTSRHAERSSSSAGAAGKLFRNPYGVDLSCSGHRAPAPWAGVIIMVGKWSLERAATF